MGQTLETLETLETGVDLNCSGTTFDPVSNTTVEIKNVKIKIGKTKIKCTFFLVFIYESVDLGSSSVNCNKGAKGKNAKVKLVTPEGFSFKGVIKPPDRIISMSGGDFYADIYANVSVESTPIKTTGCGGYNGEIVGRIIPRGYTKTNINLWAGAVVEYSFVSTGDSMKDAAFFVDSKVGYSAAEMAIIMKAMKRIEAVTCIRFKRIMPEPGKQWMLIMREGTSKECYISYINANLKDKVVGRLGKPFSGNYWSGQCFGGAYASWLGAGSPTFMVSSKFDLSDSDGTVGLYVHELLHILGVGHTQKRPDRDNYITVNYNAITESGKAQYSKCTSNCETHDSPYDCQSIMHYRDYFFNNNNGKTMTPKDPKTCDLSGYMTKLTAADITLLKVL